MINYITTHINSWWRFMPHDSHDYYTVVSCHRNPTLPQQRINRQVKE